MLLTLSEFTVKFATGHDDRQTDSETTQPQRFGAPTCHQIGCLAAGAAYAACAPVAGAPSQPASSRVRGNGLAGLLFENQNVGDAAADARPFTEEV